MSIIPGVVPNKARSTNRQIVINGGEVTMHVGICLARREFKVYRHKLGSFSRDALELAAIAFTLAWRKGATVAEMGEAMRTRPIEPGGVADIDDERGIPVSGLLDVVALCLEAEHAGVIGLEDAWFWARVRAERERRRA